MNKQIRQNNQETLIKQSKITTLQNLHAPYNIKRQVDMLSSIRQKKPS